MLKIKRLNPEAKLPQRATTGSAGYDLYACIDTPITIEPGSRATVPLGIAVTIPEGYAGFIYARSSLGTKYGVVPANCVGVIDSDYRGEVTVVLLNNSTEDYTLWHGERIAQMVLTSVFLPQIEETVELEHTERGEGGFGSTGKGEL